MENRSIALARARQAIAGRYDRQETCRILGHPDDNPRILFDDPRYYNLRKDWTPAQKRRMRKKLGTVSKKFGVPRQRLISV